MDSSGKEGLRQPSLGEGVRGRSDRLSSYEITDRRLENEIGAGIGGLGLR
jgi:hypothetical protein